MDIECICYRYILFRFTELFSWCKLEANTALRLNIPMVACRVEEGYDSDYWLGVITSATPQLDCSTDAKLNSSLDRLERERERAASGAPQLQTRVTWVWGCGRAEYYSIPLSVRYIFLNNNTLLQEFFKQNSNEKPQPQRVSIAYKWRAYTRYSCLVQ